MCVALYFMCSSLYIVSVNATAGELVPGHFMLLALEGNIRECAYVMESLWRVLVRRQDKWVAIYFMYQLSYIFSIEAVAGEHIPIHFIMLDLERTSGHCA